MPETNSITAIKLTRSLFESVHGNIGLLNFNIEELTPTNGTATEESKKWKIICSFYETLGSTSPSRYEVTVDLNTNSVSIKKLSGPENKALDGTEWTVTPKKAPEGK
ncbi:MAG: hypothetical protein AAB553_01205 [Patescibacteria group bacterium]